MSIEQKYFQQDKNYLLKTVQAFSKEALLAIWTDAAYKGYMAIENPMGLEDDFTLTIKSEIQKGSFILEEAYDLMAATYRFRHSDNQLTFMWDGRTHMEYYDEEWRKTFIDWVSKLSLRREIYRSVIKAALADQNTNTDFLSGMLRRTILDHFKIRLTRSRRLHALAS